VREVKVVRSSGSERLDQAAVAAVRQAAPFPPFPRGVRVSEGELYISLRFSLQDH